MTSLTALAHSGHAAAPAFNATFYATAATVIPVLFLALALQGPTFMGLIRTAVKAEEARPMLSYGALGLAIAICALGCPGELVALLALYQQHGNSGTFITLCALVLLTLTAGAAPIVTAIISAGEADSRRARVLASKALPGRTEPSSNKHRDTRDQKHGQSGSGPL